MVEKVIEVNFIINDEITIILTKVKSEYTNNNKLKSIYYEVIIGNEKIITESRTDTEDAVLLLQKSLPHNIKIACCQSCMFGNFNPFGDYDNEIFCFKDIYVENKIDVCNVFLERYNYILSRKQELLYNCMDYQQISDDKYYTYNDWNYIIK